MIYSTNQALRACTLKCGSSIRMFLSMCQLSHTSHCLPKVTKVRDERAEAKELIISERLASLFASYIAIFFALLVKKDTLA